MRTNSDELGLHPTISSDTKALWVFDKGTGNVVYDIVSGRDVTDASGPTWVSGKIGKAVDTGAAGRGFIDSGTAAGTDSTFLLGTWSLECWIRPMDTNSGVSDQTIIEYSHGGTQVPILCVYNGSTGHADFGKVTVAWIHGGGAHQTQSTARLPSGVWSHVVFKKFDAGGGDFNASIHINGVLDVTGTKSANAIAAPNGVWKIGDNNTTTKEFGGQICSMHLTAAGIGTETARDNWRRGVGWQHASQTGHGKTYLDVQATTSSGGIDQMLTEVAMGGAFYNMVESVSITESVDNQAATATLQLKRNIYEISLAPTMTASPINQTPATAITHPGPDERTSQILLAPGTLIYIWAKRVPNQYNDPNQVAAGSGGELIFQGTIDSVNWATDIINVECVDQGALVIDTLIELPVAYNTPNGSSTVQAAMQLLLDNNMFAAAPTLYTPVDPGWTVGPWKQRSEPLMQALQSLADQIGFLVKYKWDPVTQAYRLTLHDPIRAETRFDAIITVEDYTEMSNIQQSLTNVRNVVRVTFSDSAQQPTGVDGDGNNVYPVSFVDVQDASSITAYGRRAMHISESATSNIDTAAEATIMAESILADLKTPDTNVDLDLPYWEIEINDRLMFEENAKTFDTAQTFCVVSKTVSFSGGLVACRLQLKEAPANGVQKHIVKEAGPGRALPPSTDPRDAVVEVGRRGYLAPIQNLLVSTNLLRGSGNLSNITNPAMITNPAPQVMPPSGWSTTGTWAPAASGGDAYFSTTAQTGTTSLALLTVNTEATSYWMPVIGGQTYLASCTWQAPDAGDKLDMFVDLYNSSRVLTSSVAIFSKTPTAVNVFQTDSLTCPTAANDRFARIRLKKTAGPEIIIDRVGMDLLQQAAETYSSAGQSFTGGTTTTIVWNKSVYNYDDFYNSSNGQFTASRYASYQFHVYLAFGVGSSLSFTGLGINMTHSVTGVIQQTFKEFPAGTTSGSLWLHTAPVYLDRGDVITFELVTGTSGTVAAGGMTCVGYRFIPMER